MRKKRFRCSRTKHQRGCWFGMCTVQRSTNERLSTADLELGKNAIELNDVRNFKCLRIVCYFWKRFNGSYSNLKLAAFIYCMQDQNQLILLLLEWVLSFKNAWAPAYNKQHRNRHKCVKIEHWSFKMLNVQNFECWIGFPFNRFILIQTISSPSLGELEYPISTNIWMDVPFQFVESMHSTVNLNPLPVCKFKLWMGADFKLILLPALHCINKYNTYNPLTRICFKINFTSMESFMSTFWKFHLPSDFHSFISMKKDQSHWTKLFYYECNDNDNRTE